ncbi:MAG: hypothetical protein B7Z61_13050 [Acidobacteria bacterium 37-71-11]|nr:MAG: hypothetical protein B7Z61_13050 [Acidobacteria bacterium 37-71-11]
MRSSGEPPKKKKSRQAPCTGREGPGRSPEWQEAIFEGSRDAIFISDEDSRFIAVNRAACDLTGYAREELLDLRIPDLHEDVDLDAYHRYHGLIMAGQAVLSEAQLLRKDGTKVATEFNSIRIVIDGTRYEHTTARDITERHLAEAAFRERDEFCQRIFDGANDAIVIIALDGRILEANLTASRRLGYTVDELRRMTVAEIDSPEAVAHVPERIARILGEGHAIFETVQQRRDGSRIPTEVSSRLINHRGATAILSILRDLSERKRLEEEMHRLAAAIEQTGESIVITDAGGTIEYVNPAFTRMTGYGRDEALGRKLRFLSSRQQPRTFYREVWTVLARGDVWHGHFLNKRKDMTLFEADATISPVRDETGKVARYVAVQRDVTQEMGLEAQLRQVQKREAIGRLAGSVAHDFNNLLQAMLSHVQLLQREPHRRDFELADLEGQIQRGAWLAQRLLLFSRPETARREQLDLNEAVRGASKLLRRLLRENIILTVTTGDGPFVIDADGGQLDQVLMNLALNAADAMPTGGRLTIRTGRANGMAWFDVEDTGTGVPKEICDKLFEPFFTTKPAGLGTGLGLSIVQGIVTGNGGRIEMQTEVNEGTTFRVLLPEVIGAQASATVAPAPGAALPHGNGERVLLVEDETGAREALREILISLGYEVTAVGSGADAGRLPFEPVVDVLLTDIMLPDVDGVSVARGLLDRWPNLKVILMSGYSEDEAQSRAAELGGARFLQKPFGVAALAAEIRAALMGGA